MACLRLRGIIPLIVLASFAIAPAGAQNALQPNNMRTDEVYDGITYDQALRIYSGIVYNGSNFTVTERATPNGSPYFILSSPQLPFTINITVAEDGYSGDGDGVYAGVVLFTTISMQHFPQDVVNDYNYTNRFVKFSPAGNYGVYSVDLIAAGGVTHKTLVSAFIPFFGGLNNLIKRANTATTVSYGSTLGQAEIIEGEDGFALSLPAFPAQPQKISTRSPDAIAEDRLIADFVDAVAHRR